MSYPIIIETPEQQLARVQAAIAAIETGAQEVEMNGRKLKRGDLKTLYDREQQLLNRLAGRGGIRISRIVSK